MSRYPRTPIATKPTRRRSSYLLHHDFVRLDDWCHKVRELVGDTPYHVGSSTQRVVVPRERLDQPMWCTIYRSQLTRELERLAHPRGE